MIAVYGVRKRNAPSKLPLSITIAEEYDRNYTAVLIQGKEGNMFEKKNVRN